MNVKTCRKCRRLFNYVVGEQLCPSCKQQMEEDFQKVKKYVNSQPNAKIPEVAEACDVTAEQIRKWLREERLFLSGESPQLTCDNCGALILTGKLCEACKNNTIKALQSVSRKSEVTKKPEPKKDPGRNKMHFLDK